ncbi:hypothetical protein V1525DRAFT_79473 [Lipomyces kononenkoae]|uniref:Uncharacterized protein n=1 Tax=Lipomyces kononenkoae TaxID=34357 RepID=A0ACC3SSP8_LIPKO
MWPVRTGHQVESHGELPSGLAIRPLTKPSKDFLAWINHWEHWEHSTSHANQKGVADATDSHVWFEDLSVALKDLPGMDSWVTAYGVSAKVEIREGTLSFRTMANDLREEIRRRSKPSKGSNGRIAREHSDLPFGTLRGEPGRPRKGWHPSPFRLESKGKGISGKVSPNKRKRQSTEGPARGRECQACGQLHPLSRCFYGFPGKIASWWRKIEEIQKKVVKALKSDEDLIKKSTRLKRTGPGMRRNDWLGPLGNAARLAQVS